MANTNRGDLRTQVLGRQFSSTQYTTFTNQMLEEAQQDLASQIDFRILFDTQPFTTVAGTNTLAIPSDFMRLDSFVDAQNFVNLPQWQPTDFDNLDLTQQGQPVAYVVDGTSLKLYPTPDAAYSLTLRYYRFPTAYATDADLSDIPRSDKCLRYYALARAYERENDMSQAQYHEQNYEREKQRLAGWVQNDANDSTQAELVAGMWNDEGWSTPTVRIP